MALCRDEAVVRVGAVIREVVGVVERCVLVLAPAFSTAEEVDTPMAGDRERPGPDRRPAVEGGESAVDVDEHPLLDIGRFRFADHPSAVVVDPVAVVAHGEVERAPSVAGSERGRDLLIGAIDSVGRR